MFLSRFFHAFLAPDQNRLADMFVHHALGGPDHMHVLAFNEHNPAGMTTGFFHDLTEAQPLRTVEFTFQFESVGFFSRPASPLATPESIAAWATAGASQVSTRGSRGLGRMYS